MPLPPLVHLLRRAVPSLLLLSPFLTDLIASDTVGVTSESFAKGGPFSAEAGDYGGIVEVEGGSSAASGIIELNLSAAGSFSGKLNWQGSTYPFKKDKLNGEGGFTTSFAKADNAGVTLLLKMSLSGRRTITGTLEELENGATTLTAGLNLSGLPPDTTLSGKLEPGMRVAFIDPPNNPSGLIRQSTALPVIPGDGFAVISIGRSKSRSTRTVGRLPDYQGAFSFGSALRGSQYSVFSSLYKRQAASSRSSRPRGPSSQRKFLGQVFGRANVADGGGSAPTLTSQLRWGKLADHAESLYPGGFDTDLFLDGKKYPKVHKGGLLPIILGNSGQVSATMRFRDGNLGTAFNPLEATLNITPFHTTVAGQNPYEIKIKVSAANASFKGTFKHPASLETTPFEGSFQAATLTPGEGRGSFAGSIPQTQEPSTEALQSGSVRISVNLGP
jgi:hypothetical protein